MIKEFREFIARGNVIDLAVGIIIGAAFTAIVNSLVNDIISPPLGVVLGGLDFSNIFIVLRDGTPPGPYPSLEAAQAAGAATINIGVFVNQVISFLITAFVVFLLVRAVNRLKRNPPPEAAPAVPDAQQQLIDRLDRLATALERQQNLPPRP